MRTLSANILLCCFAFLLITAVNANQTLAQQAQIDLELQINESLANSQVINVTKIIANNGSGANLFSIFIENLDTENLADDLYLNLSLRSDKNGLLADLYQARVFSFSLDPGQRVFSTNSFLNDGLPGVEENINFDGGLTPEGKEFINQLGGSTNLPPDRYVLRIEIFQNANARSGGILVASDEAEIGGNITGEVRDIFLTNPGDVIGSEMEITTSYPEFRWEAAANTQYRLIVVKADGRDSPETLLQSSFSTEPILENGSAGVGSLLEYEILDVRLQNSSFQMPPSGVQKLEEGKRYYWQVFAELPTTSGRDIISSEIWEFTLKGLDDGLGIGSGGDLGVILGLLLDGDTIQISDLQEGGFKLISITIDGQTITGPAMLQRLSEFQDNVSTGEITVVNN